MGQLRSGAKSQGRKYQRRLTERENASNQPLPRAYTGSRNEGGEQVKERLNEDARRLRVGPLTVAQKERMDSLLTQVNSEGGRTDGE